MKRIIMISIIAILFTTTNVYATTFVEDLLSKTNDKEVKHYSNGNMKEMYTFEHDETDQTNALTDYRFIGERTYDINNHVYFNCEDDNDKSSCEIWNIIGVFDVEDETGTVEQRVKLLGPSIKCAMYWDFKNVNDWSTATLNNYFNSEVDSCFKLSDSSKSLIGNTKYYLGGVNTFDGLSGPDYYKAERGTEVYEGHSTSWVGKIGLMYPSDLSYTYALGLDDGCFSNLYDCNNTSWLGGVDGDQWLITPYSNSSSYVHRLRRWGYVDEIQAFYAYRPSPVVYLKTDTKVSNGDGSKENPYQLIYKSLETEPEEPTEEEPSTDLENTIEDVEKVEEPSEENPETLDNVTKDIVALIICLVIISSSIVMYKRNNI